MRALRFVPLLLLLGGGGLIGDAIARGAASVALLVVVPVIFGASSEFLVGVVLLVFGFATLPLALGYRVAAEAEDEVAPRAHVEAPPAEVGGLLLIGPVPIFFGRWGRVSRRVRLVAAAAGAALLVVALAVFLWVR